MLPIRGTKGQTSSYVSNAPQPECKFIVLAELLTSVSNTFNKLGFIGLGPLSPSSQSWRRTHEQTRQWLGACGGVVSTSQNWEHEYFPLVLMQLWMLVTCFQSAWVRNRCCGTAVPSASLPGSNHYQGTIRKQFGHYPSCGILLCNPYYHCGVQYHCWHRPGCQVIFGREARVCQGMWVTGNTD